jgi:hypothetical protein
MFSFFRQKILQCFKSFLEDETNLGGGHTKLAILFFLPEISDVAGNVDLKKKK